MKINCVEFLKVFYHCYVSVQYYYLHFYVGVRVIFQNGG